MTTSEKIARRKLSLLELAKDLGNVSKACKIVGYSREQFYQIRRNFQTFGAEGLVDRVSGPKNPHPNRLDEAVEQAILDYCLERPSHGPVRVAHELALKGINVSSGGVRGVWLRHNLATKHERLLRLEKATQEKTTVLTSEQVRILERFSPEFRDRHIEAPHTGSLVAVDTFMVGTLKGVGKVYLQTAIDCHRLPFPRRIRSPVYKQVASDRGASTQHRCTSLLRTGSSAHRNRFERQWPRILRPPGSTSL